MFVSLPSPFSAPLFIPTQFSHTQRSCFVHSVPAVRFFLVFGCCKSPSNSNPLMHHHRCRHHVQFIHVSVPSVPHWRGQAAAAAAARDEFGCCCRCHQPALVSALTRRAAHTDICGRAPPTMIQPSNLPVHISAPRTRLNSIGRASPSLPSNSLRRCPHSDIGIDSRASRIQFFLALAAGQLNSPNLAPSRASPQRHIHAGLRFDVSTPTLSRSRAAALFVSEAAAPPFRTGVSLRSLSQRVTGTLWDVP